MTNADSTLAALSQSLDFLRVGGLITLVLYSGHPGGDTEAAAVKSYAKGLSADFLATQCTRINTFQAAPELLVIERLKLSG